MKTLKSNSLGYPTRVGEGSGLLDTCLCNKIKLRNVNVYCSILILA